MSRDEVDNLHAAEDHIGCLQVWMNDAADMLRRLIELPSNEWDLQQVIEKLTFEPYCRLDCANGECSDDCGCQAHGDDPHPGWVRRRRLAALRAEFGLGADMLDPDEIEDEDEWALIENNSATTERWATTHVDLDSATKYAESQEDAWQPLALINLDTGERFAPKVERSVAWLVLVDCPVCTDSAEPQSSCSLCLTSGRVTEAVAERWLAIKNEVLTS